MTGASACHILEIYLNLLKVTFCTLSSSFFFAAAFWRYSSICAHSSLSDCNADWILLMPIKYSRI